MTTLGLFPGNKVHVANMGPIWGRQDPGGPHVGPMNFAIWVPNACHIYILVSWNIQKDFVTVNIAELESLLLIEIK